MATDQEQVFHPARRGDLAVVEIIRSVAYQHDGAPAFQVERRYAVGVVTGVNRDGLVTSIRRLTGMELERGDIERRDRWWGLVWIVPRSQINLAAVRQALEGSPRHDFGALADVRALLSQCLRVPERSESR